MQDVILEISNYLSLKTARLLCKNVNYYNVERYFKNMIRVTATEINDYKKTNDIGISITRSEWHLGQQRIYFCLDESTIKIDQSRYGTRQYYINLDLISYYNILRLRSHHPKMKMVAKNKVISMLQNELSNLYCKDRMAFSDTYINLAVNCHLMGLQDIGVIDNTIIRYHGIASLRADALKMYKMVMNHLENL